MTRFIYCLLLLCLAVMPAGARHITGRVIDASTREELPGGTVELLSVADSSVIRSTVTVEKTVFGWKTFVYQIDVDNNTSYLLRCSMMGYKTQYRKVSVKMADRVNEQYIEDFCLEPEAKMLSEVVVKATKIKMVMRGDTVVYDASALNLSEGSMLDALVRQMPGTTLQNGVIKVNGRTVSSLLIDGRDFFKGDAKKALENLPAFTVDKVRVYDKAGKQSRLMGRDMGDKSYVLDVGLKKQYQHGAMGNVDVSGGSNNRYSGRLFAMFYTKKSRLTMMGNANNVNDSSVPGENGDAMRAPDAGGGLTANRQASVEYRREGRSEDEFYDASVAYSGTDNETRTRTNTQTFLTGGDYYGLQRNSNRNINHNVWASLSAGFTPKAQMVEASMSGSYGHRRGWGGDLSGRFSGKPWSDGVLDSLFMPEASARLMAMAVNRVKNDNNFSGKAFSGSINASDYIRLGGNDNNELSVSTGIDYSRDDNDRFALNRLDYLSSGGDKDHRNQYSQTPTHNYNFTARAEYALPLLDDSAGMRSLYVRTAYDFKQAYESSDYSLYRLDRLDDYTDEAYPLGMLPSSREALMQTLDAQNSYRNQMHTTQHTVEIAPFFKHGDGTAKPMWMARMTLPLNIRREHLLYYRAKDYDKLRNAFYFNPSLNVRYQFNDSTGMRFAEFNYTSRQSLPELSTQLDIRDDANPLNVTLGNPGLKKARSHSISLMLARFSMERQQSMSLSLGYGTTHNAFASAMIYDKATGVTTTRQVNVNGNWNANGNFEWSMPIDKLKRLTFNQQLGVNFNNSVDLTTVEGTEAASSNVRNWVIGENIMLTYQLSDRLETYVGGRVSYRNANSRRVGFQSVNAWDYNVRMGGHVKLPWKMELASDITDYARHGYNNEQMNRSELVWNARLTKRFMADRLAMMIDGYDILGNLNSTTFVVNEQGRTETWTNSIPRYVMLHLSYKLSLGMAAPRRRMPWE